MSAEERVELYGIAVSPGIVQGPATVFDRKDVPIQRRHVSEDLRDAEVVRLEAAVEASRQEVKASHDAMSEEMASDQRLLLEAQLMLHGDALLIQSAATRIREDGINAEWGLRKAVDALAKQLASASDAYFRERAIDVRQVGDHILRVLTGTSRGLPEMAEKTILIASELSPSEAARLSKDVVVGLILGTGSASGHTAILARALGLPCVVGVRDVARQVGPGDAVVLDALKGRVVIRPSEQERVQARTRAARFEAFQGRLKSERARAQTRDGEPFTLRANIELERDVAVAVREEASGIGLYRTEYLYLDRSRAPSEEEQTAIYRRVAERVAPEPVIFRTFDLGADKMPQGFKRGPNPALGLRALRVAFERPELLVTQLRSLLRAGATGNVQVMFPMVTGVADLRGAKVLLERARRDLEAEGAAYGPVQVGTMLEVPAAIVMADRLAPHCDFFSVGTNDLTQYALAVDRTDPRVAHLARGIDPAVLRLLARAVEVARAYDTPISICGELGADPVALPLLVGLGFRNFSMSVSDLPLAREVLSRLSSVESEGLAKDALDCDSVDDVERLIIASCAEALGELWAEQGLDLIDP